MARLPRNLTAKPRPQPTALPGGGSPGEQLHLFGLTPEGLREHLARRGVDVDADLSRRIQAQIISRGGELSAVPQLPNRVRDALGEHTRHDRLELVERVRDEADGFVKYLLRHPDGALSEAVRIPLHIPGRYSACLSSQIGCAMECAFCATGRMGLSRQLEAWEIVAAFIAVRDDTHDGRVGGAVFMGQGEPFHNYERVLAAANVLRDPCGGRIAQRAISISTVGLVPQIRRYTREGHRYKLIVSLTSADPERRRSLLPVAGRQSLEDLAAALREHALARRTRVTVAYVMLAGINTGADEVAKLEALLGDTPVIVNLIDVNDPRPDGFRRPDAAELSAFRNALQALRAPIIRRYSGGASRHAACGMLQSLRCGSAAG
jgi:23S rRNA (adenine2503-C2)-methyltransferase